MFLIVFNIFTMILLNYINKIFKYRQNNNFYYYITIYNINTDGQLAEIWVNFDKTGHNKTSVLSLEKVVW